MPMMPPTFRPKGRQSRQEQNTDYDRRRGSARERGYDARWDRASLGFRQRNPLCLGCSAVGRTASTSVTDHVIPHRGDMAIFWDREQWQPACDWHHSVVKQQLEQKFDCGEIGADALWLNSPQAITLTRALAP
jgi:5-methylcytosine-specific restriction endonuclease McrA